MTSLFCVWGYRLRVNGWLWYCEIVEGVGEEERGEIYEA